MFGNPQALYAYLIHARGNLKKARTLYDRAFAAGCDRARFYAACGVLLLRNNEFENAKNFLAESLAWFESDKRFAPPKKGQNKRYTKSDRANIRVNLALAYWKNGDIDHAVQMLDEVYAFYKNASFYGSYGYLLIAQGDKTGDYTRAEEINAEALDYEADDAVIQDNMGQLRYRQGRFEEARVFFQRAHELRADQIDSIAYLAFIAHELGEDDKARELADKALSMEFKPLGTVPRETVEAFRASLG